jgi:hypothetical protein
MLKFWANYPKHLLRKAAETRQVKYFLYDIGLRFLEAGSVGGFTACLTYDREMPMASLFYATLAMVPVIAVRSYQHNRAEIQGF